MIPKSELLSRNLANGLFKLGKLPQAPLSYCSAKRLISRGNGRSCVLSVLVWSLIYCCGADDDKIFLASEAEPLGQLCCGRDGRPFRSQRNRCDGFDAYQINMLARMAQFAGVAFHKVRSLANCLLRRQFDELGDNFGVELNPLQSSMEACETLEQKLCLSGGNDCTPPVKNLNPIPFQPDQPKHTAVTGSAGAEGFQSVQNFPVRVVLCSQWGPSVGYATKNPRISLLQGSRAHESSQRSNMRGLMDTSGRKCASRGRKRQLRIGLTGRSCDQSSPKTNSET